MLRLIFSLCLSSLSLSLSYYAICLLFSTLYMKSLPNLESINKVCSAQMNIVPNNFEQVNKQSPRPHFWMLSNFLIYFQQH